MKNSTVKVRGLEEDIAATYSEAETIKKIWEDKTKDPGYIIHIGKTSFQKKDIRLVILRADRDQKASNDLDRTEFYNEERKDHYRISKLKPEEKAKFLDLFDLLYFCATNIRPTPAEVRKQAYDIQLQFFKENPARNICDAHLLKALVQEIKNNDAYKLFDQAPLMLRQAGMKIIERAIYRDMQLSGQIVSSNNSHD